MLRPLALDSPWTDEEIGSLAQRLGLSAGIMHELYDHLREPCAAERAGLPYHVRNYLTALHCDTWFTMRGQTDFCRTSVGSRPGDCFADTIFGYLWAKVLKQIEDQLVAFDVLDFTTPTSGCSLFLSHPTDPHSNPCSYLGPCWIDDLAVCLSGSTSDALIAKLGTMVGYLMDTFLGHAMTPNTAVGKTELLLSLRGSKSRAWKHRFHGPVSDQHFHVLGEHQCHSIKVTGRYCHLGGIIHHTGDLRAEARHRLAQAHQLFTRQRHVLFRNKYISGPVKSQIFDSVVSRLNYGSETWVLSDQQTKHCIHSGIMKLYRRLLGCGPNAHLTDDEILIKCDEPSPQNYYVMRDSDILALCTSELAIWIGGSTRCSACA